MLGFVRKFGLSAVLSGAVLGSAFAADMPTKAPALEYGPWMQAWGGYVVVPGSWYAYSGTTFALNRNLDLPGWLFRIAGGVGHYNYNTNATVSHRVNFQAGEAMIGYQTFIGATRLTGYIGGNFEDHHNNTDPLAIINGTRGGFKAQGEIFSQPSPDWFWLAMGTYSTAWNNYFLMGKIGYNLTPAISIGPEVMALANDKFSAVRAGPFIAFNLSRAAQLILSGGHSWDTRSDAFNNHSGAYGTIHIRSTF